MLCLERIALTEFGSDPAASDVKDFTFDPLMGPEGGCRPSLVDESDFGRGTSVNAMLFGGT